MKADIRKRLENYLLELDTFNTAWEGVLNPVSLPYQAVFLQITESRTATIGQKPLSTESGFLQITLYFETGNGAGAIERRAEQIRQHFYGYNRIEDDLQIIIAHPPLIGGLFVSDGQLALPITVYFNAYQL